VTESDIKSSCIFWTRRNENILPLWCLIKVAKRELSYGASWSDVSDCLKAANSRSLNRLKMKKIKRNDL